MEEAASVRRPQSGRPEASLSEPGRSGRRNARGLASRDGAEVVGDRAVGGSCASAPALPPP
eukprot:93315-Alexandrium_andersonii.AAC.1